MLYLVEPEAVRQLGAKVAEIEKLVSVPHRWEPVFAEQLRRELRELRALVANLTTVLDHR